MNITADNDRQTVPDFDLLTTEGKRARREDFAGERPVLLCFASLTSPSAHVGAESLKRLHKRFGDRVSFLTIYVGPADDRDGKLNDAYRFGVREALPWPVAVDTVDGSLHKALGGAPNGAVLMTPDGRAVFTAPWSCQERALAHALEAVLEGRDPEDDGLADGAGAVLALAALAIGAWTIEKILRRH